MPKAVNDDKVLIVTPFGVVEVNPDLKPDKTAPNYLLQVLILGYVCGLLHNANFVQFIDMHNVLDRFGSGVKTPFQNQNSTRMSLSWVRVPDGPMSKKVVKDMEKRIGSGQIAFGIVCFKRGDRKGKKLEICTAPGSKAGIISVLAKLASRAQFKFFDDARDHILSVESLSHIRVEAVLVPKGKEVAITFLNGCN